MIKSETEYSAIHKSTIVQTQDNHSKGLYYNSSYEIENFVQVYQDNAAGDPFKVLNDPTFTGFKLFFHFGDTSGLFADESYTNSALAYLKRIGDESRYNLLKRFIVVLSKVNSITPWIFQDVNGMQEMYNRSLSEPLADFEITIGTLETLDNKIMSLVEMYRQLSFDYSRWCYVLPENLRRFSMSIYLYDFRMFSDTSQTAIDLLQTLKNTDIRKLNHIMFDLFDCQFHQDSGKDYFSKISSNTSEAAVSNLTINVQSFETSSTFRSIIGNDKLSGSALELANASILNKFTLGGNINNNGDVLEKQGYFKNQVSRLKNSELLLTVQDRANEFDALIKGGYKNKLMNIADDGADAVVNRVESELTKKYLGNVYGFGLNDLARLAEDDNFKRALYASVSGDSQLASLTLDDTKKQTLGNINTP